MVPAYLDLLHAIAASVAQPGSEEVAERYDDASESTTIASHVGHQLFYHGTS